ncbi:MAG: hypothetical protein AB8E15_06960 [Bdellovibrionales bacterium]
MIRVLLFLSLLLPTASFAQQDDNEALYGWAYSLHTGPFLPNQIENVTEIQPTWGLRFTFPTGNNSASEYSFTNSNAEGVTYWMLSYSGKTEFDVNDLIAQIYLGIDAHTYKVDEGSYRSIAGGHFGLAMISHLGGFTHFRADMKFNVNPGTSLYLGFGLEMRYPPGDDSGEDDK